MSIHIGDNVRVNKDITRAEGPYAREGEEGVVVELFRPQPTGAREKKPFYAKVRMNAPVMTIKTFRLTSLERAD